MATKQFLALAALCCVVVLSVAAGDEAEDYGNTDNRDDGDKIYDYLRSTPNLKPEKTLWFLIRLHKLYVSGEKSYAEGWDELLGQLIGLSKVGADKCHYSGMYDVGALVALDVGGRFGSRSLTKYVHHFANEQYKVCEQYLHSALVDSISKLDVDEAKRTLELIDRVVRAKVDPHGRVKVRRPYPPQMLAELPKLPMDTVAWAFVSHARFPMFGSSSSKLNSLLRLDYCRSVQSALGSVVDLYEHILVEGLDAYEDEFAWQWVTAYKLCTHLLDNSAELNKAVGDINRLTKGKA